MNPPAKYSNAWGKRIKVIADTVCMCGFHWPPVRGVCLNNEVVVFQNRTLNLPKSIICHYIYNFKSSPPAPPISTVFMDHSIYLLHPTATLSSYVHCCSYFSVLHPLPKSSPGVERRPRVLRPHLPTTRLCRSSLCPAPLACFCRRFPWLPPPPLCHPRPAPSYLSSPGGFAHHGSVCLPCSPTFPSQIDPPNPIIFQFFVSLLGVFLRTGKRLGRLHSLEIARPFPCSPLLLGHTGSVQATRLPHPPTPCSIDPTPIGRRQWGVSLEVGRTHAGRIHCRGWLAC